MTTIMPTTLLGVLPIGLLLYKSGSLEPEEIVLSIILSMALVGPIMGLTTYLNSLKMIKYAARSLDEVLEEKELPDTKGARKPDSFGIEFDNVSFAYHEDDPKVLDRLSFEIKSGKFTALIGPSGGGKSTVARLISRFWDVTEGTVKVGGINIKDISTADLSHYISYVAQDNYLFNCSLKENIRLGNPQASDEEVYAASKAAMCHDFIEKMDDGYDTQAGTAGNKLSGGEKQRIAIARMILRNAPIVVLDEATAYTDPENEEKIQTAISNLTKGKTLIVIAHRLSTIAHADNIIILDNGQINAQGTHEELLKNSKLYQSMWNAHIGAKNRALEGES
jgi:ATP-binding cassette subfamily B protein